MSKGERGSRLRNSAGPADADASPPNSPPAKRAPRRLKGLEIHTQPLGDWLDPEASTPSPSLPNSASTPSTPSSPLSQPPSPTFTEKPSRSKPNKEKKKSPRLSTWGTLPSADNGIIDTSPATTPSSPPSPPSMPSIDIPTTAYNPVITIAPHLTCFYRITTQTAIIQYLVSTVAGVLRQLSQDQTREDQVRINALFELTRQLKTVHVDLPLAEFSSVWVGLFTPNHHYNNTLYRITSEICLICSRMSLKLQYHKYLPHLTILIKIDINSEYDWGYHTKRSRY